MNERSDISRILVATDLDECSVDVVEHAKIIARRFGAKVMMLHVVPIYANVEPLPLSASVFDDMEAGQKRAAHSALERFRTANLDGISTTAPILEAGDPATAILAISQSRDADLIVMGTHGRSGVTRALLGSVAEQVIHETDRSVMTIRCTKTPRQARYSRILCPVNYTAVAGKAFRQAMLLASAFEAELIVLYLIENDSDDAAAELHRLRDWIGGVPMSIRATLLVQRGKAAVQVNQYAAQHDVDLIVVGAQRKRIGNRSVLSSTTNELTRHSSCPVLTVPAAKPRINNG
jgi:nucleotide-binding universal stress UspA family protein